MHFKRLQMMLVNPSLTDNLILQRTARALEMRILLCSSDGCCDAAATGRFGR